MSRLRRVAIALVCVEGLALILDRTFPQTDCSTTPAGGEFAAWLALLGLPVAAGVGIAALGFAAARRGDQRDRVVDAALCAIAFGIGGWTLLDSIFGGPGCLI